MFSRFETLHAKRDFLGTSLGTDTSCLQIRLPGSEAPSMGVTDLHTYLLSFATKMTGFHDNLQVQEQNRRFTPAQESIW